MYLSRRFLSVLLAVPVLAVAQPPVPVLVPGFLAAGKLRPGESREFSVAPITAFRAELNQIDGDFAIDALDANRRVLRAIDAFGWSKETATFPRDPGVRFLRIRRADTDNFSASFELSVVILPDGVQKDDLRILAEDASTRARELARKSPASGAPDVLKQAREAIGLWRDVDDAGSSARASLLLADTLNGSATGFDEAYSLYSAALTESRARDDIRTEAECLGNRGVLLRRQSSFDAALTDLRDALDLWKTLPVQTAYGADLNNIALLEWELGEYAESVGYYARADQVLRILGSEEGRAFVTSNLALVQGALGDWHASVRSFESAAAVFRAKGNILAAGRALTNSARMYLRIGDARQAEGNVREGIALVTRAGDNRARAEGLNMLGEVCASAKRPNEALRYFRESLDLAKTANDRHAQANALANIGMILASKPPYAEGIDELRQARDIYAATGTPAAEASVIYRLALAREAAGDLAEARDLAEQAVSIAETLRGNVAAEQMRISFLASTHDYYSVLIDILMRQGNVEEGWRVAERSRARSLLDSLDPGTSSSRARDILRQLNSDSLKLWRDTPDAPAIKKHIESLTAELDRIQSSGSPVISPRFAGLDDVRAMMGPDTVLIEYSSGDSGGYAWVVGHDSLNSFHIPSARAITAMTGFLAELLKPDKPMTDHDPAFLHAATPLSAALIVPAISHVRASRLILVTDGPVDSVPFSLLPLRGSSLLEIFEVLRVPSASVAVALAARPAPSKDAGAGIALVADPVFDSGDSRVKAHAAGAGVPRFGRLLFSRREAQDIASLKGHPPVSLFFDFDASRQAFTSGRLAAYSLLNISTHNVVDSGDPSKSGLVLSLVDRDGKSQDGLLTADEVAGLHLNAATVVLDGCDTLLGRQFPGEGQLSTSRAFLFAGADRVVATMWRIDDQASAELLTNFYRSVWYDSLSPSAALRKAQLALRSDPRWRSPFFWASFVLQGEP